MSSKAIVYWAEEVRRLRRAKALKQAALAQILGVDQATVSRWERGEMAPSLDMQKRLRDLIRQSVPDEWLYRHSVTVAPGIVVVSNVGRVMQAVSPGYAAAHGLPQHEMPGRCNKGRFDPDVEWMLGEMRQRGFYRGEVASVTGVCRVSSLSGHRKATPVKGVWTPTRIGDEIFLRCDRIDLPEAALAAEVERNGGMLRFVMMDELVG